MESIQATTNGGVRTFARPLRVRKHVVGGADDGHDDDDQPICTPCCLNWNCLANNRHGKHTHTHTRHTAIAAVSAMSMRTAAATLVPTVRYLHTATSNALISITVMLPHPSNAIYWRQTEHRERGVQVSEGEGRGGGRTVAGHGSKNILKFLDTQYYKIPWRAHGMRCE